VFSSLCFTSFQGTLIILRVASQYTRRRDNLGVGVLHHRPHVTIESLAPALSAVAHLRVVDRRDTVSAHPLLQCGAFLLALHILQQQLPQQFGRLNYLLALRALYRESPLTPAR
jgi:hypothetical protein